MYLVFCLFAVLSFQHSQGLKIQLPSHLLYKVNANATDLKILSEEITQLEERVDRLEKHHTVMSNKPTGKSTDQPCPKEDHVVIGDWVLAYRLTSGAGGRSCKQYMDDGVFHDPKTVPHGCLTLNTRQTCNMHFKSCIIPHWNKMSIDQVKIVLVKDNAVMGELVFDGSGSGKTSWFSLTRIRSSPWTDLKKGSHVKFFSINGYFRKWYILQSFSGGCLHHKLWLMIVDDQFPEGCSFDNPSKLPQIHFNTKSSVSHFTDMDQADLMAVMVKFKSV